MDPNANLDEQINLAHKITNLLEQSSCQHGNPTLAEYAGRLAELVIALDGWITNDGFLPEQWTCKE
jgi:hypothetical protein